MLKKSITYNDYNGQERTEPFYFNMTKAELMEMEAGVAGGFVETVQRIIDAKDTPSLIQIFKKLILDAYGEKSVDGKHFFKKDEYGRPLSAKFEQSPAYSVLFMELATNAESAAQFINGIVPADMAQQIEQANN